MIIGNERAQQLLKQFFEIIRQEGRVNFPFLLLHGPQHIGKTSIVETEVASLTGMFGAQDYRALYDLSEKLGKPHIFKVEVASKDQRIEIDGKYYIDQGARDIVSWLSLAPAGEFKVALLENIERMNTSAANALLKTLEEPLEQRLIIATTTNKDALLDTILSRAFIVDFSALSSQQIGDYLRAHHPELTDELQVFLQGFSLGRVGLIEQFLQGDRDELEEMADHFVAIVSGIGHTPGIIDTYGHFQYFQERNMWRQVCEALAFICSEKQVYAQVQQYVQAYKLSATQVNDAHVAFQLALHG